MRIVRDNLWKIAFRLLMRQFVEFFFPNHADEVDWDKGIEFLDKELNKIYNRSSSQNRVADVLVRLYLKTGKSVWMLLHAEIQGYADKYFEKRMHQMGYRIEDLFDITPVMLCILTDDDPDFHPKKYESGAWGSSHSTKFVSYKVMKNPPKKYLNPDSIVSIIMEVAYEATKAEKRSDNVIMNLNLTLIRKLLTKGFKKTEIHFLVSFIFEYVKFGNDINYSIFDEKIDDMVQYETTEELLENFFDPVKRMKWFKEAVREEVAEEVREEFKLEILQAGIKALQERENVKQEREQQRKQKEHSILLMLDQGIKIDMIAKVLQISVEEILEIQDKYKDNNPLKGYLNGHG